MIKIGWLVNGTFYDLDSVSRVEMIKNFRPNVDIIEVFAEREPCVKY